MNEAEASAAQSWTVYRIDDNGNVFVVKSGLNLSEAQRLVAEFEARGHKQMYWAEAELTTS
jgi:hypothetical protein